MRQDANRRDNDKNVGARINELVIPRESELHCDSKGFRAQNGQRSDGAAYRNVDKRILLAVFRSDLVDHEQGERDDRGYIK